jgi:hypothetical protein
MTIQEERARANPQKTFKVLAVPLPPQPHERFRRVETNTGPTRESKHGYQATKGMQDGRSTPTPVLYNEKPVTSSPSTV